MRLSAYYSLLGTRRKRSHRGHFPLASSPHATPPSRTRNITAPVAVASVILSGHRTRGVNVPRTIASHVDSGRSWFVGREAETALFRAALDNADPALRLLFIYGVRGIGKTALLRQFELLALNNASPVLLVERPKTDAQGTPIGSWWQEVESWLESTQGRRVLILDGFDATTSDPRRWLPLNTQSRIPSDVLVVLGGDIAPPLEWSTDMDFRLAAKVIQLMPLTDEASVDYVTRRGAVGHWKDAILDFAKGYPLALSLATDSMEHSTQGRPVPAFPDVSHTLLQELFPECPPAYETALIAYALAAETTEDFIVFITDSVQGPALFKWLCELPFTRFDTRGISPPDYVRSIVVRHLRWKNNRQYLLLRERARTYYLQAMFYMSRARRQLASEDLIYLYNRLALTEIEDNYSHHLLARPYGAKDRSAVLRIVRTQLGPESERIARDWLTEQPEYARVLAEPGGRVVGYLQIVKFGARDQDIVAHDVLSLGAFTYLEEHAPLKRDEHASLHRFRVVDESRTTNTAGLRGRLQAPQLSEQLSEPRPAFVFMLGLGDGGREARWNDWNFTRIDDINCRIDDTQPTVYGHDWRIDPLDMGSRLPDPTVPVSAQSLSRATKIGRSDFETEFLEFLRSFTKPWRLTENMLLSSRIVLSRLGPDDYTVTQRIAALAAIVKEAVDELAVSKRGALRYDAIRHTYIQPVQTQREAARMLDLPISTYRRYLSQATQELTSFLWLKESAEWASHS